MFAKLIVISRPYSCHWRYTRLPAEITQLGSGSEHRDGCVTRLHAEPVITARRRDHPQERGPADEKQVGVVGLLRFWTSMLRYLQLLTL